MSKLVYLSFYMILVPLALGGLSFIVWKSKDEHREVAKNSMVEFIFQRYAIGVITEFAIWEVMFRICQRIDGTYGVLLFNMTNVWKVTAIAVVIVAFVCILLKREQFRKQRSTVNNQELKTYGWIRFGFVVVYIAVSVLFVLPSSLDNTVNQMVDVLQFQIIASHHEFIYVMLASLCGIELLPFTHYILNGCFLILFFGSYSYIEGLLFEFNPKMRKVQKLIESMFAVYVMLLFFIRGSLYTAVPQNIWNSSTILASVILPMTFMFGFGFVMEHRVSWLLKMILMMLVVDLFYAKGSMFVALLIVMVFALFIVDKLSVKKVFRDKVRDEDSKCR